jgi:hypothetical protein
MKFDSISEGAAAPFFATLGGFPCQSFAPLLSKMYEEAAGVELEGKPDYLFRHSGGYTFVDTKSGKLNHHHTQGESTNALKEWYRSLLHRSGDHLSHSALSDALYYHNFRGQDASRDHSFHHSVFKLLALQAQHGWQRFLVVFAKNPAARDAKRYCKAGLVWCTEKTLPDMLHTIELLQHGFYIPFVFTSRNYSFTVTPDHTTKGLSCAEVEFIDRTRFLATVAADKAAAVAKQAQDDADFAAGISPF